MGQGKWIILRPTPPPAPVDVGLYFEVPLERIVMHEGGKKCLTFWGG